MADSCGLARSARLLQELPTIVDAPELPSALDALALARRDTPRPGPQRSAPRDPRRGPRGQPGARPLGRPPGAQVVLRHGLPHGWKSVTSQGIAHARSRARSPLTPPRRSPGRHERGPNGLPRATLRGRLSVRRSRICSARRSRCLTGCCPPLRSHPRSLTMPTMRRRSTAACSRSEPRGLMARCVCSVLHVETA